MITTKHFIIMLATFAMFAIVPYAAAQTPPPLENNDTTKDTTSTTNTPSFGKITIQISQTEQIVLDLPLKSDNKYTIAQIK